MALIDCPECGKKISGKALLCPHCGFSRRGAIYCFEYRSKKTCFGLPLLHIVLGPAIDPSTGRPRVAKGIVAVGGVAIGVLSLGGVSFGIISLGGVALGLLLGIGGAAVGLIAIGGAAVGYYVMGGGVWGIKSLESHQQVPEAMSSLKQYLLCCFEQLSRKGPG